MTRQAHGVSAAWHSELARYPFTVVDELSCYFDTVFEPANVHLEARVPGRLDQVLFRDAATAALRSYPRASARRAAVGPLSRRFSWEHPGDFDIDPVSFAEFGDAGELAAHRARFIGRSPSLDTSPPVLLLLATGPDCCHVILNAHHAAMDGLSCVEVLREVGRQYRARSRAPAEQAPRPGGETPTTPAQRPAAARARRLIPSLPARIAPEGGGGRGCDLCLRLLPGIPAVRAEESATLNDALISALIVTVGRWNAERGRRRREVRVTVPVNARQAGQSLAIGNHSRLVTIAATPPADMAGVPALLRDVAGQIRRARQQPSPPVDSGSRRLARLWLPPAVKRRLVRVALRTAGPMLCDTVMLTNIGNTPDPPDFGQEGTVTLLLSSTAHMPRGLSIGVATSGGQPVVAMRFNRALLDESAASRFLASYIDAIGELTAPDGHCDQPSQPLSANWSSPASAAPAAHQGEAMALEPALLKILACPVDKGSLLYYADEGTLYNPRLRRRYQIRNEVPVMLAHQAESVTVDEHTRLMHLAGTGKAVETQR
jgi:uncharacterized protein YbaR (Trm112 family)/NRPS condensation-like uncharacterized protein